MNFLLKFFMAYVKLSVKLTTWFLKEFGPALVLALIPTVLVSIPVIILFGTTDPSSQLGVLVHDPKLSQNITGISWLAFTAIIYVAGWQIIVQVPKNAIAAVSSYYSR